MTAEYNGSNNFIEERKKRVNALKALAKNVIDNAEDYVGSTDLLADFSIELSVPTKNDSLESVPCINISRTHYDHKAINAIYFPELYEEYGVR